MIHPSRRRLAEVAFPIAVVSKHAAREKFICHGHLTWHQESAYRTAGRKFPQPSQAG